MSHRFNAHNAFFRELARAWQPILRTDGFGAFNAHRLDWREGYASRTILLHKSPLAVRVQLWQGFNGAAVREIPHSPQSGAYTSLHVLELSPNPEKHRYYAFAYGDTEAAVRANVGLLVDAYMRIGRPFFRLS